MNERKINQTKCKRLYYLQHQSQVATYHHQQVMGHQT